MTSNYLLAQERADHRQARDDYHTLTLKFRENPSEFSDEDRNTLINAINYLKMEVFTDWSSVSVADEVLLELNFGILERN